MVPMDAPRTDGPYKLRWATKDFLESTTISNFVGKFYEVISLGFFYQHPARIVAFPVWEQVIPRNRRRMMEVPPSPSVAPPCTHTRGACGKAQHFCEVTAPTLHTHT